MEEFTLHKEDEKTFLLYLTPNGRMHERFGAAKPNKYLESFSITITHTHSVSRAIIPK